MLWLAWVISQKRGLYNAVAKSEVLDSLAERSITAAELVSRALRNGARDDISSVIVKIKSISNRGVAKTQGNESNDDLKDNIQKYPV
jgi:hypothetical protein